MGHRLLQLALDRTYNQQGGFTVMRSSSALALGLTEPLAPCHGPLRASALLPLKEYCFPEFWVGPAREEESGEKTGHEREPCRPDQGLAAQAESHQVDEHLGPRRPVKVSYVRPLETLHPHPTSGGGRVRFSSNTYSRRRTHLRAFAGTQAEYSHLPLSSHHAVAGPLLLPPVSP